MHNEVIDAHGDQVDTNRIVTVKLEGKLKLGADTIGRGDQYRWLVLVLVKGKQPAEATDVGQNFRAVGRFDQRFDHIDEAIAGFNVNASVFIGHTWTIRQRNSPGYC